MKCLLQSSLSYISQTVVCVHTTLTYLKVHILSIRPIYYSQAIIILFILKSSLTFSILCDHITCDCSTYNSYM